MNERRGPVAVTFLAGAVVFGGLGAAAGGFIDNAAADGVGTPTCLTKDGDITARCVDDGSVTLTSNGAGRLLTSRRNESIVLEEKDHDEVKNRLGEACAGAVSDYWWSNGRYNTVSEDGAVNDIVGEPEKTCGYSPGYVRSIVEWVRRKGDNIAYAREREQKARDLVEDFKRKRRADENFSGARRLGALAAFAGGLEAVLKRNKTIRAEKRKEKHDTSSDVLEV